MASAAPFHVSDEQLDRLSAELKVMTKEICDADFFNEGNGKAARNLAFLIQDVAFDRPMLAIFADLLVRHATRESAIAELVQPK